MSCLRKSLVYEKWFRTHHIGRNARSFPHFPFNLRHITRQYRHICEHKTSPPTKSQHLI